MRRPILLVACLLLGSAFPSGGAEELSAPALIELKGKAPDWWTPEIMAKADLAGQEGKLLNPLTGELVIPQEAAESVRIPVGAPDYLFIRPGSLFLGEDGALCTYNFIYGAGTQIGVAGHCVTGVGERVYILSFPAPTVPLVTVLGTVTSFSDNGIGNDWALVNIHANWRPWVDPNMAWLGGPSCSAWNGSGGVVKHAGHGTQTGLVASVPRASHANPSNGNSFQAIGELSSGDSGGPVIKVEPDGGCTRGSAAGIATHCASLTGLECLPIFYGTDIRRVPAIVTVGTADTSVVVFTFDDDNDAPPEHVVMPGWSCDPPTFTAGLAETHCEPTLEAGPAMAASARKSCVNPFARAGGTFMTTGDASAFVECGGSTAGPCATHWDASQGGCEASLLGEWDSRLTCRVSANGRVITPGAKFYAVCGNGA